MSPLINPVVHGGVPEGESVHPLARPFVLMVRGYQLAISPVLGPKCRFYPSCSAYTVTAIERFGPVRGIWLGTRRIARCHPWQAGGVDHVPERDGIPPTGSSRTHPPTSASTARPRP